MTKIHTDPLIQELVDSYEDWFLPGKWPYKGEMTKKLWPYTKLFSPIKVNKMTIKNRIVMAPMGNITMCEETGRPNEQMIQYLVERAKGGVGLITTGLIPVSFGVDPSIIEPGDRTYFPRIDTGRSCFSGWRQLAQGVHAHGAKIFIQLTPGLGRVGNPQCLVNDLKLPVSASWNPNFYMGEVPCRPLCDREIKKIVKMAGQAAADAKECGLDGVYLHGHEGYLLDQLTNSAFNRRKLGHYADTQQFGIDLIEEIRERVGPDYPIMYRIDLTTALNETYGDKMLETDMKKFVNGRTIHDTVDFMKNLVKAGVDMFDVDLGCYDNWWLAHMPNMMPPACFAAVSRFVKEEFAKDGVVSNAGLPVPIVEVGKLNYPDVAEQVLRDGSADMVMLGRPLLADEDWANKAYAGDVADIRPCIGCQEGCVSEFVKGGHPTCAVNPRTAYEYQMPKELPTPKVKKRVCVIGGGPAGTLTAMTAAERGHDVTLVEKTGQLGGQIVPGCKPGIKFDIELYLDWLQLQARKLEGKSKNFRVLYNTEANAQWVADQDFDSVVVAIGADPIKFPLPGSETNRTVTATQLLLNPSLLEGVEKVAIIGGGDVGCECAYWLRKEHNKDVSVVEMLPAFMESTVTANRGNLIHYLGRAGVPLLNCTRAVGIRPEGLDVVRNVHKSVPDPYMTWHPVLPENVPNPLEKKIKVEEQEETIPADLIVFAAGLKPRDELFFQLQAMNAAPEVQMIGDVVKPGRVLEATQAANRVGRAL